MNIFLLFFLSVLFLSNTGKGSVRKKLIVQQKGIENKHLGSLQDSYENKESDHFDSDGPLIDTGRPNRCTMILSRLSTGIIGSFYDSLLWFNEILRQCLIKNKRNDDSPTTSIELDEDWSDDDWMPSASEATEDEFE